MLRNFIQIKIQKYRTWLEFGSKFEPAVGSWEIVEEALDETGFDARTRGEETSSSLNGICCDNGLENLTLFLFELLRPWSSSSKLLFGLFFLDLELYSKIIIGTN